MKNKTIKKNNNPRNITIKHNKKTKKKTNKKGKSNILKKTKKINRKNKKLLIGGEYNKNFFSVVLDDNFKNPNKKTFLYKFMEKYIKNLNKETDIPNEFVYNKYRKYRNDYKTKDISNIKIQDLREIRLNHYLKSVMSIMKNEERRPFEHTQITFKKTPPIYLYNEVNRIKNNYDTNIKSKLEEKDKKNTYYINCHGGYFEENLKLYTVPDNVIIHFLTPLNYLSYLNVNENINLRENLTEISQNNKNTIDNIRELLKIDCFQNMITFFPGQKCFDINLSIRPDNQTNFGDTMGIYNITRGDKIFPNKNILNTYLANLISNKIDIPDRNIITNIYINCCRSCNNDIDNLTIETMYIYENFIKQLNNSLLNIEEPIEIKKVCENSYTSKIRLEAPINLEAGQNLRLTSKQTKTNEERINKIIKFYKKKYKTDTDTENFKSTIKDEFTDDEFKNLFNYLTDETKAEIINIIHDNLNTPEKKTKFINDVYIKGSTNINFFIILTHLKKTYSNLDINLTDSIGNTALHFAVKENYIDNVKELLARREIDVNIKNEDGKTPLQIAVNNNNSDIVVLLLKRDDINFQNYEDHEDPPLQIAIEKNNLDIVKLFLAHPNINVNFKNRDSPLHIATAINQTDIVKELLAHPNINVNIQNENKDTPLHFAVKESYIDIVKELLARIEINVKIQDFYGETPLDIAVYQGYINIVELLLARLDINVNSQNKDGNTPLHSATIKSNINIVELLLARPDINVNSQNKDGKTPLQIAELNKNDKIIELIKNHKPPSQ